MATRNKVVKLNLNLKAKYRGAFERLSVRDKRKLQGWMQNWLESAVVALSTDKEFPSEL